VGKDSPGLFPGAGRNRHPTRSRSGTLSHVTLSFPGITEVLVEMAGMTVARTVQDPGWRWSTDVRPLVGGEWCEARHVGVM